MTKINLDKFKDRNFDLKEDSAHPDKILIIPNRLKIDQKEWEDWELPFRSVIIRKSTGEILSAGFPKFFNLKERGTDYLKLMSDLKNGREVIFTEKYDGSLCIRSVIDGEVVFRTRGTFDGGDFAPAMRKVAEEKYPVLLNPNFYNHVSLLFEFVSSDFRVVIDYKKPDDLILIGAVHHSDFILYNSHQPSFHFINANADYSLTERSTHDLPVKYKDLIGAFKDWPKDSEGVVAVCNGGQTLVKIKSPYYLKRHRLKFAMTEKAIVEVCKDNNITSQEHFESYIKNEGGDWELIQDCKPIVARYLECCERAADSQIATTIFVNENEWFSGNEKEERKKFAKKAFETLKPHEAHASFAFLEDRSAEGNRMLLKYELEKEFG